MKLELNDQYLLTLLAHVGDDDAKLQSFLNGMVDKVCSLIIQKPNFKLTLDHKIQASEFVLEKAWKMFPSEKIAIAWTGGKDSTLILWLLRKMLSRLKQPMPSIMLINEGELFDEIVTFTQFLSKKWKFSFNEVSNDDVLRQVKKVGDVVNVASLNTNNQLEIARLGYAKQKFPFEPESLVGNHLMKTVPQNNYITNHEKLALITGIRWDEQKARAKETYFSPRGDSHTPVHTRIHPILHMTEKDIWDVHHKYDIPYCELYAKGYRSLGAKSSTTKNSNNPAWEQDLDHTSERQGRNQDKEAIMQRLRELGYM